MKRQLLPLISLLLALGLSTCGKTKTAGPIQTEESAESTQSTRPVATKVLLTDADATRDGAQDLGDITDLSEVQFPRNTLNGSDDEVDYYKFSLTAAKEVGLALRQLDFNADLFLENDTGTVLSSSENSGTDNEWTQQTLLAGTYYARVQAQETGDNAYVFRYGVSAPDADMVAQLEGQNEQDNSGGNEEDLSDPAHQDMDTRNIGGLLNTEEGDTDAPADASTTATVTKDDKLYMNVDANHEPILFWGNISHSDDVDWIRVMLEDNKMFRISLIGQASDSEPALARPDLIGLYRGDGDNDYIDGTRGFISVNGQSARVIYSADATAFYYVAVSSLGGETGAYNLRVLWVPDDIHPDNTNTRGTINVGESHLGSIHFRGDEDWFRVDLTSGTTYQVELTNRSLAKRQFYPKLTLRNSAGKFIKKGTRSNTSEISLSYTPENTGTYFFIVSAVIRRVGRYTLTLSED